MVGSCKTHLHQHIGSIAIKVSMVNQSECSSHGIDQIECVGSLCHPTKRKKPENCIKGRDCAIFFTETYGSILKRELREKHMIYQPVLEEYFPICK